MFVHMNVYPGTARMCVQGPSQFLEQGFSVTFVYIDTEPGLSDSLATNVKAV